MSRKYIGDVGVDSGQLMITDPCYVKDFDSQEDIDFHDSIPEGVDLNSHHNEKPLRDYPYTYGGACAASCNKDRAAVLSSSNGFTGVGACFSTGYGDGMYPVYVEYNEEGRVKSVTVEFLGDDEEDNW